MRNFRENILMLGPLFCFARETLADSFVSLNGPDLPSTAVINPAEVPPNAKAYFSVTIGSFQVRQALVQIKPIALPLQMKAMAMSAPESCNSGVSGTVHLKRFSYAGNVSDTVDYATMTFTTEEDLFYSKTGRLHYNFDRPTLETVTRASVELPRTRPDTRPCYPNPNEPREVMINMDRMVQLYEDPAGPAPTTTFPFSFSSEELAEKGITREMFTDFMGSPDSINSLPNNIPIKDIVFSWFTKSDFQLSCVTCCGVAGFGV